MSEDAKILAWGIAVMAVLLALFDVYLGIDQVRPEIYHGPIFNNEFRTLDEDLVSPVYCPTYSPCRAT